MDTHGGPTTPDASGESRIAKRRRGFGWYVGLPFRALRLSLFSNAFFLMLNTAIGAILGAVFWLIAARFYPESDVGFAAALIPLTTFLANVGTLGLPIGLVRFLPEAASDPDRTRRMANTSMTLGALASMTLAVVFVLGSPAWAPSFFFIRIDPLFFLAFVLFCGLFAIVPTIDAVALAYRKAKYAFGRNTIFNALRAPLPIAFVGTFGIFGLFFSYVLAAFVAALVALFLLLPRLVVRYRPVPTMRLDTLRPTFRFSLGNHAASLLGLVAPSVLPILVVELRSPVENAWFYIAWFLGSMLYVIPSAFSMSLYVEGSQINPNLPRDVGRMVLGASALLLPAGILLYVLGNGLLAIFGQAYATGGFDLLRWLVVATPFLLVNSVYLTLVRVAKRVAPLAAAAGFISLFVLVASWFLLPAWGLAGVGIAWFLAQGLVSIAVGAALALRGLPS